MGNVDVVLVEEWLSALDGDSYAQVVTAVELLAERGPQLGPSELRVLFAFDPQRRAILLVAGDKSGNWPKWYSKNIQVADDLFDEHLWRLRGDL